MTKVPDYAIPQTKVAVLSEKLVKSYVKRDDVARRADVIPNLPADAPTLSSNPYAFAYDLFLIVQILFKRLALFVFLADVVGW